MIIYLYCWWFASIGDFLQFSSYLKLWINMICWKVYKVVIALSTTLYELYMTALLFIPWRRRENGKKVALKNINQYSLLIYPLISCGFCPHSLTILEIYNLLHLRLKTYYEFSLGLILFSSCFTQVALKLQNLLHKLDRVYTLINFFIFPLCLCYAIKLPMRHNIILSYLISQL